MFNEFRQGSWFDTVSGILNKMSDRISELWLKSKGKKGVIPKYKDEVSVLWERCTEAKVYEINEGEKKYKVNQCSVKGKLQRPHIVDMEMFLWCLARYRKAMYSFGSILMTL
jgi:hypothetical protein